MTANIITDSNFDEEIKNSPVPVLVDFWAEWWPHVNKLALFLKK